MRTIRLLALTSMLVALARPSGRADDAGVPPAATTAPETRSAPARRRRAAPPSVVASFPGFRMNPDGTSRCFVHLSANVQPTTRSSGRRFEVLLPGVRVRVHNHLHPLETRFFDTPMLRARLERRGPRDVALVVELRADVTPTMHVEPSSGGGVDVVVELPDGEFGSAPPAPGGSVRPSGEDTSGSPSGGRSGSDRPEFSF